MLKTQDIHINLLFLFVLLIAFSCNKDRTIQNNDLEQSNVNIGEFIENAYTTVNKIGNDTTRLQAALTDSSIIQQPFIQLALHERLGEIHAKNSHFKSAIENHQEFLKIAEELGDSLQIAKSLNLLATNFRKIRHTDDAIKHYFKARRIADNLNNYDIKVIKEQAISLNGIAKIYSTLNHPEEALNAYKTSYKYAQTIEDKEISADNLMGMGVAFQEQKMYDSARVYYNKATDLFIEANSRTGLGLTFSCFGNLSIEQGEYQEALIFLNNAYNTIKQTSDKLNWMEVCFALSNVYTKLSQYAEAEKYLNEGYGIAMQLNLPYYLKIAHSELSNLYYLQRKTALAQEHRLISHNYDDLINRTNTQIALFNAYTDYEKTDSDKQITELKMMYDSKKSQLKNLFIFSSIIITLLITTFIVHRRYTSRKRLKDKRLIELVHEKSDFFTTISHDLKTPISIIMGLTEKLIKTINQGKSTHSLIDLDIIKRQSGNLLFLINEIRTVSKLQTSGNIHWVNGNIVSYLRYLHSSFVNFVESKGITYHFHSSSNEVIMDYSREQIRLIVNNLLRNAIRHCSEGNKIFLIVREDNSQQKCIIEVADNGAGISEKDLPNIFKSFYQGEYDQHNEMGMRAGLAFTKQVVESMDGKILVRSIPFKETVFTVEIPINNSGYVADKKAMEETSSMPQQSEPKVIEHEIEEKEDSKKPLILVAEDNRDMMFYLRSVLRDEYNIIEAYDGKQALEVIDEKTPDLIICDLMMPIIDGSKLCEQMKSSVMTRHIPVIILTGKASSEEKVRMFKMGANAFFTKPFDEDELKAKINQLITSRRELKEKYSQVVLDTQNSTEDSTNGANFDFLQKVTDIIYREIKSSDFFPLGLASEMCISQSQLNRKIKSISGLNTTNYILMVRLNRAKKLLATSQKPIGEIAMECGFSNFAYFSKTFKKEFGLTPSKFQRMPHMQN